MSDERADYVQVDWSTWKPLPAPDSRPRCATCRGQRFIPDPLAPDRNVVPCPDCAQPATPSGEADARPTKPYWKRDDCLVIPEADGYQREWHVPREVSAAIRAESSAALEEARAEAQHQFTVYQDLGHELHLSEVAREAAERLLQEVTEERDRLWDALREAAEEAHSHHGAARGGRYSSIDDCALDRCRARAAASRPVPAEAAFCIVHVPDQGRCLHDADDHTATMCSMCGDEHVFAPATKNEEGAR